jgi:hypothetical protein
MQRQAERDDGTDDGTDNGRGTVQLPPPTVVFETGDVVLAKAIAVGPWPVATGQTVCARNINTALFPDAGDALPYQWRYTSSCSRCIAMAPPSLPRHRSGYRLQPDVYVPAGFLRSFPTSCTAADSSDASDSSSLVWLLADNFGFSIQTRCN